MKTEELNLNKGENGWVGVTYSPSNASNKVLTWKSSNEEVVTVREGNVKAVGEGKSSINSNIRRWRKNNKLYSNSCRS